MEIIKRGVDPKGKEYHVICHNCKTEFIFQKKEAILLHKAEIEWVGVNCPVCHQEVIREA